MQILRGAAQVDLEIGQPLQTVGNGGNSLRKLAAVGDQSEVCRKPAPVLVQELVQIFTRDLLLALDDVLQIDGRLSLSPYERLGALDVSEQLAFVIGRPPCHYVVSLDGGLERRMTPEVEGVYGLHVVVAIDQDRRLLGADAEFRVHYRVPRRLHDLRLKAQAHEPVCQELSCAPDILPVLRDCTDAGNPQELDEFIDVFLAIRVDEINDSINGHGPAPPWETLLAAIRRSYSGPPE